MVILGVLIQGFGLSCWSRSISVQIHVRHYAGSNLPCRTDIGTAQLLINLILYSSFPVRYKPDRFWNDCKYDLYRIYLRYLQMDLQQNLSRTFLWIHAGSHLYPAACTDCIYFRSRHVYDCCSWYITVRCNFIYSCKESTARSFKYVRIAWDTSFLLLGWIAGGNVGPVTFAIAFFLGPVISWEQKKLAVFIS